MSGTTAQQRRGRSSVRNDTTGTVLVEDGNIDEDHSTTKDKTSNGHNGGGLSRTTIDVGHSNNNGIDENQSNNKPIEVGSGNGASTAQTNLLLNPPVIKMATVRRNFCGTGPFDKHWFNLDCCGIFCALFTYFLQSYGAYAVCFIIIPPWMSYKTSSDVDGTVSRSLSFAGMVHAIAFMSLTILAMISHFKAMTTNPGVVPPDAKPLSIDDEIEYNNNTAAEREGLIGNNNNNNHSKPTKVRRLCRRCRTFKPQRAHHCSICNRCIIKMDHHCPWVNNCVGIGNHKYFLLFVFYTFLTCLYSLALVIVRFTTCLHGFHRTSRRYRLTHPNWAAEEAAAEAANMAHSNGPCLDKTSQLLSVLGLLIEAILFGMFTSCMMFDQADVIRSKITHIDRLKGEDATGTLAGFVEVFGLGTDNNKRSSTTSTTSTNGYNSARFRLDWLSPFASAMFPPSVQDEIMGFCRPCLPRRPASINRMNSSNEGETELYNINSPKHGKTLRSVEEIL